MTQTPAAPATRWLAADEERAWRSYLIASQLLLDQLDRELLRDAGIPHTYYAILVMLSDQSNHRLRMTELANFMRYSKSRLSEAVSRLEQRGWIRREPCPTDRRSTYAVLTDEGFEALKAAAPGHVASVRHHVFDRLTPEQVQQLREISDVIGGPLLEAAGFDPERC